MILVLDAHTFLWWARNDAILAADARAAISDPANDIVVSAATIWEMEIKRAQGKLLAPPDLLEIVDAEGFTCLPVSGGDATAAARLPAHHPDPFDRMLIAQAARLDATIVSRDSAFDAYGTAVLLA